MLNAPYNILLVGDNCQDIYQYGTVDRISPEAPVPVFKFNYETRRAGMAGNVNANLLNLNCSVNYVYDQTSTKTRLIDSKSGQHIVRVDADTASNPVRLVCDNFSLYDAIVISDYNKGTVDYELVEYIRHMYNGPVFIDTKKTDLARFEGCYIKINDLEYSLARTQSTDLIVTLGRDGASYRGELFPAKHIEVVDTCGAGDTFLAALCFGYLNNGCDIVEAIRFANLAAAVTVQHSGVYAPTMEEICG